MDREYGSSSRNAGKFYLQPSMPEPRLIARGLNSSSSTVHTPHSLEFSTKRRIFDKGPEVC